MKTGKLLTQYDESKCYEDNIKYYSENWKEYFDDEPTQEEVEKFVYDDIDLLNFYWEQIEEAITYHLEKKNPTGFWKCKVINFGWRNSSGEKFAKILTGKDLVQEILPKTDCTFRLFNFGKGIAIQNFHHDSPTGNEWYYLVPVKESTYYKFN